MRESGDELKSIQEQQFAELKARIQNDDDSPPEKADQMEDFFKRLEEDSYLSDDERKAENVKRLPNRQITAAVRSLAEAGLMNEADFGYFPDKIIQSAFENVAAKSANCPAR